MEKEEYFKYTDKFLKTLNTDKMMSTVKVEFNVLPNIVHDLMNKYLVYFTNSTYNDGSIFYFDIIIDMKGIFLYFSRKNNESTYQLKIIHKNNFEEIKIFLKGLKQINKI